MTSIKLVELSPEIVGEITPDMKSPANYTPSRRHSSAKRTRTSALRMTDQKKKQLLQKDLKKTSLDFVTSLKEDSKSPLKNVDELDAKKEKVAKSSPVGSKKVSAVSSLKMRSAQQKRVLRTRVKQARKLSPNSSAPPHKMRKVDVEVGSKPEKEENSRKATSESEDDDVPLSELPARSTEDRMDDNKTDSVEATKTVDDVPLIQLSIKSREESVRDDLNDSIDDDVPLSQLASKTSDDCIAETLRDSMDDLLEQTNETEVIVLDEVTSESSESKGADSLKKHSADVEITEQLSSEPLCTVSQDHIQPGQQMMSSEISSGQDEVISTNDDVICTSDEVICTGETTEFTPASSMGLSTAEESQPQQQPTEDILELYIISPAEQQAPTSSDHGEIEEIVIISNDEERQNEEKSISEKERLDEETIENDQNDLDTPQDVDSEQTEPKSAARGSLDSTLAVIVEEGSDSKVKAPLVENQMEIAAEVISQDSNGMEFQATEKPNTAEDVTMTEAVSDAPVIALETESVTTTEVSIAPETDALLHNWSPSRSPSSSILKKFDSGTPRTPPSVQARRVSFADPVVSGESPVRVKYQSESSQCSPAPGGSPGRRSFVKSSGRLSSGYKRRLESSLLKKDQNLARFTRCSPSPTQSPLSQSSYKSTLESQLDSVNPIFPALMDCQKPLDSILPQLTSSLWYRGLCQMMKGRNLNTIGDLCALTEVQINQLPIRNPKVETVRMVLTSFMTQHGLQKPPVVDVDNVPEKSLVKGATVGEPVTPSSIADEGLKVRASDDAMLQSLSPIKDTDSSSTASCPRKMLIFDVNEGNALSHLKELADHRDSLGLKEMNTKDLFEMHQTLNNLFSIVVEEMKSRQPSL